MVFPFSSDRTLHVKSAIIPDLLGSPALVPVSLQGTEALDSLFSYQLLLKTPDSLKHLIATTSNFDTQAWRGQDMSVQIQLDGQGNSGMREINGIIDDARFIRIEERFAFYQVTLRPWLYQATLAADCRIFQHKTVKEIIDEVLAHHPYTVQWRLLEHYPRRAYTTQFNESSFAFISRLCETWGISYFFEHSEGTHRLVFIDNMGDYQANAGSAYQNVLFQDIHARIDEEYLHTFVPANRLTSGALSSRDYDYTRPRADLTLTQHDPDSPEPRQEVYAWHSPDSGQLHYAQTQGSDPDGKEPLDEGRFLAKIRLAQLHCQGYRGHGSGQLRGMQTGHRFTLRGHPRTAANIDYLILSTTLSITDVAQASQRADHGQAYAVSVDLEVYPWRGAGPYRPALNTPTPTMYGLESAIVVGPGPGESGPDTAIWTDALGRIKIQFPWDRLGRYDQNSTCWVRVCSPWAGNQLGSIQIPRIGQEVLIAFMSGNPDLPVCVGRVHNQHNLPPWTLPAQQALSGFRSRELGSGGNAAGGRSNHFLMDDSADQLQVQLKSDHQDSQLSLGCITRVEDKDGRKDARGEGFELRTDGLGAVRAQEGLLLTSETRAKAAGHIKEIEETIQRLTAARSLLEQVSGAAQHHQAQDGNGDQAEVARQVQAQNQQLQGGPEKQAEFSAPHLLLASPAGIVSSAAHSTHIASGQHTQLTSGQHLSMSSGGSWFASVVDKFALFVQKAGMKLVAASGRISLQAQNDDMELIAKKVLHLISQADWVEIKGNKGVRLHGPGGMLEIGDTTQFFTAAPVLFHGALETLAPQNKAPALPDLPSGTAGEPVSEQLQFTLRSHEGDGHRYANEPYELFHGNKAIGTGVTDRLGRVVIDHAEKNGHYSIRLANGMVQQLPLGAALDTAGRQASQGLRAPSIQHRKT